MITITPGMTNEQLRSLAENLKATIIQMTADLVKVVDAIDTEEAAHLAKVENLKSRHAAELAELIDSHEDMTEFVANMREFISAVEKLLGT